MAEARTVAVVGGGAAGFAAALAAASAGARVTMIARAPGATSLYSGAMEIAPQLDVLVHLPHHPLNRLGMDAPKLAAELEEACAGFVAALGRAGLELRGGLRDTGAYADLRGTPANANLVPATVAGGELTALRGRRVAVVGVPEVGEYDAAATAAALRELAGVEAEAVECPVDGLGPGASITDIFGLPAPEPRTRAEAVAYPPGFTGLPEGGFELLAAAPSPHGWRLQLAMTAALSAAGVEVRQSKATGFEASNGVVTALRVGDDSVTADAFVLASGRFIGGGLEKSRSVREPLFGLQVFLDGHPIDEQSVTLHHLEYLSPEPAFRAGLLTDTQLRPLDGDGRPQFQNLRAAGAILGGRDYTDGFGFGVPLATGRLAGVWSARG
jgi:glycerol-3-phosphate dehydrogenase subunit B